MSKPEAGITSILTEMRRFHPPAQLQAKALVQSEADYRTTWERAACDPMGFWAEEAKRHLSWFEPWQEVFRGDTETARFAWFEGGKLNAAYNCIDRHLARLGDKAAIIWEGEPGDSRTLSYRELHREVIRCAGVYQGLGLERGDVITLYMPMIPELAIAVLAAARLGLMHNVVFAGFSSEALIARHKDAGSKLLVTADGGYRRGKALALKETVDRSLRHEDRSDVRVLVVRRTGEPVPMRAGRDLWWHEAMAAASDAAEPLHADAEDPLFLLYTSGSTGQPKGIVHTTGGYLLGAAMSTRYVFNLQESDIYWCTADIGWITGHSYVLYGPLANGATVVLYEGAPDTPDWGRFWQIVAKHRVSKFYTAPTAIRSFMRYGAEHPRRHDLSSLEVLGTVGEPINPEAWIWYHEHIGDKRCPIVDTWWQTETGAIMISALPGATVTKPGSASKPFWGIVPAIVDELGKEVACNTGGHLVITQPWPSMARTIHKDHERFRRQYWERFPGRYFTGDGARCDEDGDYWIMGRVDDVLNVAGHRLSTMEIESALVSHSLVAEAAAVGRPDPVKGEAVVCFVTLRQGAEPEPCLSKQLSEHVVEQIGALARPAEIRFADALPKTRSGKIMRRFLRSLAAGQAISGDTTSLENQDTLSDLAAQAASAGVED